MFENHLYNLSIIFSIKTKLASKSIPAGLYWTSGTDAGCEGKFGWCSVNKLAIKAVWATGQPDNFGGKENCLGLNMTKVKVELQDEDCLKQYPFICEVIRV
jgi:Lectin C-type domain